jgi:hypothetical protein
MRPLLALVLSTVILGSVWLYLRSASHRSAPNRAHPIQQAEGKFDVEITLSFDAGPDAFALSGADGPSLIVEHLGKTILRRSDAIAAGTAVVVENVAHVQQGKNSFFVRCTPRSAEGDIARAVRVRILRDGAPVADATLWSAPGAPCDGVVDVDIQT